MALIAAHNNHTGRSEDLALVKWFEIMLAAYPCLYDHLPRNQSLLNEAAQLRSELFQLQSKGSPPSNIRSHATPAPSPDVASLKNFYAMLVAHDFLYHIAPPDTAVTKGDRTTPILNPVDTKKMRYTTTQRFSRWRRIDLALWKNI